MSDEKIIDLYYKGYSIDYIARCYYRYKNKDKKPIVLNGVKLFPAKIYNLSDCKLYIYKLIYIYIINDGIPKIQTASSLGRGAI
ncbi:MAG: hypothetical protein HFJ60_04650 [Clostridia bacterium]|jgi:hypothetical protein|nr:hypothetical protein [Clostridia bacterium]